MKIEEQNRRKKNWKKSKHENKETRKYDNSDHEKKNEKDKRMCWKLNWNIRNYENKKK